MPNYCENFLTITGDGIQECINFIQDGDSLISLQKICPMPEALKDTRWPDSGIGFVLLGAVPRMELYKQHGVAPDDSFSLRRALRKKYPKEEAYARRAIAAMEQTGYSNWRDWRNDHWGTKWDVSDSTVIAQTATEYAIDFDSAWNPPLPVIDLLSQRFPSLRFHIQFHEGSCLFNGYLVFRDGRVVERANLRCDHPVSYFDL